MEAISGWSFQQSKWLGSLPVGPVERLEQMERLFAVLYQMGLVQRWKPKFAIALLRTTPVQVSVFWLKEVEGMLAESIKQGPA